MLRSSKPSSAHRLTKPLEQSQALSLAHSRQYDQAMGLVVIGGLTIYCSKNHPVARFITLDIFLF
jgi:hypothetical protein